MRNLLSKHILKEENLIIFYLLIYLFNNISQYYFSYYPKFLFAAAYLWILVLFIYRTAVTKEYLHKKEGIMSLIFILVNCVCTFIYKANWRFSVFPDFAILIFFIPICLCADYKEQSFKKILHIFIAGYFLFSLAGLIGELFHLPYIHPLMNERGRGIYLDLGDSGIISYVMTMVSVYFLHENHTEKKDIPFFRNYENIFHLCHIIVQIALLMITKSRTAMLCLMICFFALGYCSLNYHFSRRSDFRKYKYIFLVLIILIGYFIGFSKYGPDRNMYSLLHGDNSLLNISSLSEEEFNDLMVRFLSGRYVLWKGSLEYIMKSPIYGYGLKSGGFTYGLDPEIGPNSHNLFINSLLFAGIIGTSFLCWMLIHFFRKMNQGFKKYRYLPLKIFLYSYLLSAMTEPNILYNGKTMNAVFWIILGYGIKLSYAESDFPVL